MKKDELKNELSQDEYRNYSMKIKEIMGRFSNIKDAIEEENEIWRSY